jgi:nucleoside-diphosphate-sugar epimerase
MILKNKKILVTGASGFISSHLVKRLLKEGAKVYAITKYNSVIDNLPLYWETDYFQHP